MDKQSFPGVSDVSRSTFESRHPMFFLTFPFLFLHLSSFWTFLLHHTFALDIKGPYYIAFQPFQINVRGPATLSKSIAPNPACISQYLNVPELDGEQAVSWSFSISRGEDQRRQFVWVSGLLGFLGSLFSLPVFLVYLVKFTYELIFIMQMTVLLL